MDNQKYEVASMILKFYNMQTGRAFRLQDNAEKINVVSNAVDKLGGVAETKIFIKKWINENPERANTSFTSWIDDAMMTSSTTNTPATTPTEQAVTSSLGILEQALMEVIKKQSVPQIEKDIKSECTQLLQDFIKQEYGSIERKITTVIDGVPKKLSGVQHEEFETVLKFVANNEPVFLTGPAGSGKNVICKQVAEALDLKFYFTNAVTQEYKLTGFTDANGRYQETQFYKAFKNGGLFMLDEMDASIPEVLVILNAAIANRYFDFPAPIGYVEAHPDFRVVAAGNTTGNGADYQYVGRNQLDGASLDRFAVVPIDYSVEIENNVACDIEIADFCREFRASANKAGVQIIVSYRGIQRFAKMCKLLTIEKALQTCLLKGIEKDDIHHICNGIKHDSKYMQALKKLAA